MKKFIILCRYEYWAKKGKRWCEWYVADSTPRILKESKQKIAEMKASSAHTAKLTKLNYEYKSSVLD